MRMGSKTLSVVLFLISLAQSVIGFNTPSLHQYSGVSFQRKIPRRTDYVLRETAQETWRLRSSNSNEESLSCWNPNIRRLVGGMASLGAIETAYLTLTKLAGSSIALCETSGCDSVLSGPYSVVPYTDIPLASIGFLAYVVVTFLAVKPILEPGMSEEEENMNRVALTAISTAMATFSVSLMAILFGVIQGSCQFCLASAAISIIMTKLLWLGGCVPAGSPMGKRAQAGSVFATVLASVILFTNVDDSSAASTQVVGSTGTSTLLAASNEPPSPPPITTKSSKEAMELASKLEELDARFYGAFWCSHCFDQKQRFGKEAFAKIKYIECSKEGKNSQTPLCREKKVPGYPTFEIKGELYPGERDLDELEEIVKGLL